MVACVYFAVGRTTTCEGQGSERHISRVEEPREYVRERG